jgi:hypothetical protein
VLVRWPLIGFVIGSVTGDPIEWHRDRRLVGLCSRLTLVLAAPCVIRVIVQYPLWATHHAGWLGVAKIAMGWPLQLLSLAIMAWMLGRDHTPILGRPEEARSAESVDRGVDQPDVGLPVAAEVGADVDAHGRQALGEDIVAGGREDHLRP